MTDLRWRRRRGHSRRLKTGAARYATSARGAGTRDREPINREVLGDGWLREQQAQEWENDEFVTASHKIDDHSSRTYPHASTRARGQFHQV